jgi:hypothetical protein
MGPDSGSHEEKIQFLNTCARLEQIESSTETVSFATAHRHTPNGSTKEIIMGKRIDRETCCNQYYQAKGTYGV